MERTGFPAIPRCRSPTWDYREALTQPGLVSTPDTSWRHKIQLDFINPQSAVQRWRLFAPKQVGISACSDAGDNTLLQFIDGSNPRDTEDCMIKVVQAGPIYEGYFTGTVLASDGVTLEQITDGYFYYDPTPTGSGASLPAGTNGAAIRVTQGGGSYMTGDSYVPTTVQNGYSRPGQHFANFSGDGITFFQMNGLPETTGTYACGENPNGEFQTVSMMFEFTYRNSYGSSVCEITINMAGNTYEGSFTATLFNQEATESVSIEGEFRFPAPQ